MSALSQLAAEHRLLVQSHVAENRGEIAWVRSLHPDQESYTGVYDAHGLLGERTILAHGVYLEPSERALLRARPAAGPAWRSCSASPQPAVKCGAAPSSASG